MPELVHEITFTQGQVQEVRLEKGSNRYVLPIPKKVLDKKEVKTIVNEVKEEKNKKEVEVEVVKEEVKKENDTSSTLLKGKQQRRR